ncbi:GMC oxidoreductase [Rubrivirga sp. SAORIC476]|uniref:GMC oxidoreductase n=1 Tax=Rubrivirga sp. SAORIC476 TaxID=1961794 RepID=UPI0018E996CB|nr:GMC family oxidoreductase [Rubrivirga sp. SAORIC476]
MTYDLCIIGAGVGGGALAHALAPTGKRILLLNRLGSLPREAENWDPKKLFTEDRYKADERWTDDATGDLFRPGMYYWLGGNTKVYGSALLRNRPEDFEALQTLDGLSPAWPISYADLAPFYDQAEAVYHVHGNRGADPFEPPADGPFPHAPIPHDARIAEVAEGLRRQGVNAFDLPMGVRYSHETPGAGPFILRETFDAMGRAAFDGFPDLLHLKADAETATVLPATAHDNVDLVTGADVTRIVTDASGRTVTHVEAVVDGEPVTFHADVFALCAGAVNSAALLLRSASDAHPDGLANRSGAVGRHFMRHVTSKFYTIASGTPNPTRFQKTLAVNDFYFGVPGDPEWENVPLGHIHLMGKHAGWQILQDLPHGALTPEEADQIAAHSVDWWVQSEDLPLADNRITLGPEGGIRVRYTETNRRAQEHLMDRLEHALRRIGFDRFLRVPMPLAVVNHQCGTCRMGTAPSDSVVDPVGRAHDLTNLYIADASVFPSSAATNPTLTIAANAFRVGEHLDTEVWT